MDTQMSEQPATNVSEPPSDAPAAADPPTAGLNPAGALAGLAGAVVAVGLTEFLTALASTPSMVLLVGNRVIQAAPGEVAVEAIDRLGTNNKPALTFGLFIGSAMLGALAGHLSRLTTWRYGAVLAAASVGGWLAAIGQPDVKRVTTLIVALVAAATGAAVYLLLAMLAKGGGGPSTSSPATQPIQHPTNPHHERRSILGASGLAVIGGAAFTLGGRALQGQNRSTAARATARDLLGDTNAASSPESSLVAGLEADTPGLSPYVTPNSDFYKIDTSLFTPRVDIDTWTLKVTGLVDNELELSFQELAAMERVEKMVTLSCVSNPVGGPLVGNAVWTGVPLTDVLGLAGVRPEATQIASRSVDGWSCGFPTELASDGRDAIIALTMNGEPLPPNHGFPARMVVAGLYGYVSATKWLSEIELTTWEGFNGYWMPRGWSKIGPVKTQSRIDVPAAGQVFAAGDPVVIAGVAWAPDTGIDQVEVRIDGGDWKPTDLGDELTDSAWRQWRTEWNGSDLAAGVHAIQVRATDRTGEPQTGDLKDVIPDGATGWHTVAFEVRS